MTISYRVAPTFSISRMIKYNQANLKTGVLLATLPANFNILNISLITHWPWNNGALFYSGFTGPGYTEWIFGEDITVAAAKFPTYFANTEFPQGTTRDVYVLIDDNGTAPTQGWTMFSLLYELGID